LSRFLRPWKSTDSEGENHSKSTSIIEAFWKGVVSFFLELA
jgi:hypothetical protein